MKNNKTYRIPPVWAVVCAACLFLFVPMVAFAIPYTYTYTGNTFNDVSGTTYTLLDRVTASLTTIDGMLPDNAIENSPIIPDISGNLQSWLFSDGHQTLSSSGGASADFLSIRVSAGMITYWNLGASNSVGTLPDVGSSFRGIWTSYEVYPYGTDVAVMEFGDGTNTIFNRGGILPFGETGTWEVHPGPVPEPATMLLFGAGLVGLAGFGRKKFKK